MTRFVCGYFGCERHAARLFLAGLPPIIKINVRTDAAGQWLESSIRHLLGEATSGRPGRAVSALEDGRGAVHRGAAALHGAAAPGGDADGSREPGIRWSAAPWRCCTGSPAIRWTVAELAAKVGASRSLVAERFVQFLGEPPLTYLARWRLQLAARLLQTTQKTILHVAFDVGYESEAAFNRAFKREFGLPPAQYRRKLTRKAPARPRGWVGTRSSETVSQRTSAAI